MADASPTTTAPVVSNAPAQPDRPPDAIMTPAGWSAGSQWDRAYYHKAVLGPIFGLPPGGRVWMGNQGTYNLCIPDPFGSKIAPHSREWSMLYPKDDPRHPEDRYIWVVQPSGLTYGWKKPDPEGKSNAS